MRRKTRLSMVWSVTTLAGLFVGENRGGLAQSEGKVIPLTRADQEYIEKYLGRGVVGKAVPARPVDDVVEFLGLGENNLVTGRIVYGEDKGKTVRVDLQKIARKDARPAWKRTVGTKTVEYGELTKDGSIVMYAIADNDEGVITRYSPPEPVLVKGMEPGSSRKLRVEVEVSNLTSPEKVSHTGYLDLTYQYVGAYEVTVPLGKFDAVLLRWDYLGKIGPAKIEDHQYVFFAPGVGPVAVIFSTDVSAFLVYQSHEKVAAVAVSKSSQ
jgi:hypothetical protein